jgi:hypothetical protein
MKIQRWAVVLTFGNFGLLLIALFLLLPDSTPAVAKGVMPALRTRSLEIVDEGGEVRAQISVEPSGEVLLRLRDQEGTIRVKLGATQDGSGLVLLNDATEVGAHMLAQSTGTTLTLTTKDGEEEVIAP